MVDFEADLRQTKQNYLVDNVVNLGYDTDRFAEFMNYKKGKGNPLIKSTFIIKQITELT